jgi:hypothetical protein
MPNIRDSTDHFFLKKVYICPDTYILMEVQECQIIPIMHCVMQHALMSKQAFCVLSESATPDKL